MKSPFRVGEWLVQPLHHQMAGPRGRVKLEPRVMRLLLCLAERAPETVSREELTEHVWDGAFVTDEVLTQSVSELRKALRDDSKQPRFVTTVPKRGYRLIAPVEAGVPWEVPSPPSPSFPSAEVRTGERIAWALLAGLVALAVWNFAPQPAAPTSTRFAVPPPPETSTETLRISPDGRRIAFLVPNADGVSQIWTHEIETGERRVLPGTESALHLFWAPDSQSIGFSTFDALRRIRVTGGEPESIREHGFWEGGSWSEGGVLVLAHFGELYRLNAAGGEPARLELQDGLATGRIRPHVLPEGRHVLYFVARREGRGDIYVGSLESGESKRLVESDSKGIYADGHLLFVRGNALTAQRFDPKTLSLEGKPHVIDQQLVSPAVVGRPDAPFSASRNGILVFRGGTGVDGQLVWFDLSGRELGRVPQPPSGEYVNPSLSPDGKTIATNRRDPATGNVDIWLIDVDTNITTRLTAALTPEKDPVWSPDGDRIAFASVRDGKPAVWVKNVVGGGEELFWEPPPAKASFGLLLTDWSTDGKYLLCFVGGDTWVVPTSGGGPPRMALQDTFEDNARVRLTHIYTGRFSPDGEWIAYASNETGAFEIYVMRTSDGSDNQRISQAGGIFPLWREDGRELFYWGGRDFHGPVMRVAVEREGSKLRPDAPERLFTPTIAGLLDSRINYAVTRDGQRFLVRRPSANPSPVHVIVNWTAELARATR